MPRRAVALGVVALLVAAAVVAVAVVRPQTYWTADGGDLAESLQRAGDGFAVPGRCAAVGKRVWKCAIEDDVGSGPSGSYRLTLQADGCWKASRLQSDAARPLSGCVAALDYLPPRTTEGALILLVVGLLLVGMAAGTIGLWISRRRFGRDRPAELAFAAVAVLLAGVPALWLRDHSTLAVGSVFVVWLICSWGWLLGTGILALTSRRSRALR